MSKTVHCIIVDDELIAREILENHLAKIDTVKVVASCKNALDAFKVISTQPVDLIFLDINMPEVTGLSFAKAMTRNIKIIFTTAYREYAVDGFDLQAVDYLLKPISFERLLQAINKYLDENQLYTEDRTREAGREKADSLFVRSDRKMIRINFSEVYYVESISDYIKIHLSDKTVITRETLTNIEMKLPSDYFIKVHRSFLVALNRISSFTSEYVEVNKRQIPISRSQKELVLERLERSEL